MLDDARIFTQVVRAGTFTAAGRVLGLPKSTVSRRVAALEDRLGARLLQRTTRKLKLTDLGELYFASAARGIDEIDNAERLVSDAQKTVEGSLRVTVPADFALDSMVEMFAGFRREHPAVELAVEPTNRVVDLVAEGYDVGLRAGVLGDSSLVARTLVTASRRLYASPAYLEERGTPRTVEELRKHEVLVFTSEIRSTRLVLEGPNGVEEVDVHGSFAACDHDVLRTAAVLGLGIAVLPALADECGGGGKLVRVLPDHTAGRGQLFAVYPSARHLTPKVRAFIDFAARHFSRYDSRA